MNNFKTNCKNIEKKIVDFIKKFVKKKKVIVGLSGGIDSSIVCALAIKALGKDKIKVLIIRNSRYLKEQLNKARKFAQKHGLEIQEIDTEKIRKYAVQKLKINEKNIIETATFDARICDIIIRTIASNEDRIYLGTINGTERLTGWYPKGALIGDCCPIGGLLKEQEKKLAQHMGLKQLVETVSKDASKICSGCGELPEFKGIPYEILDLVLYVYETSPSNKLLNNLKKLGISKKIYTTIIKRIMKVKHKSDIFPPWCKINFPNRK